MENYVVYHLHSDLSNGVTNIDSVTKFEEYIDLAKQYNMKAMAFSEHGSVFEWVKKKLAIEKAGMKYIHAEEFYVTVALEVPPTDEEINAYCLEEGCQDLDDELIEQYISEHMHKVRDNYHVVLIAKNYNGVKELNVLSSKAFEEDHKYYTPRISIDELMGVSDNIMITTACLGGILAKGTPEVQEKFLKFLIAHKDNCYLEIQHHVDDIQKAYNQYLVGISEKYDIPLIAGTDTHCLNRQHVIGRKVLQEAKKIHFENEDGWDLTFKSYNELVEAYKLQNAIPEEKYLEAINNTNLMADRVEEFELDYSKKYPKLYENSFDVYKRKVLAGVKWRGVDKLPNYDEYKKRIKEETAAFVHNGAIDFMLLEEDYKSQMRKNNIPFGYSRGSCSGSVVAYLLGITEVDSVKYNLNFSRFMSTERVSLADIDTDWYSEDVHYVRDYLYNRKGLYCADIITFNTIQLKGAIDDVGRALKLPLDEVKQIKEMLIDDQITDEIRQKYPNLANYVDIVKGTIVSVGNHPSACIVSPYEVEPLMATYRSKTNPNPISQINMKEVDLQNFVKLDVLGLDAVGLISRACRFANIDYLTPDDLDFDDKNVWNSIREDTTMIFQFESGYASDYLKSILQPSTISKIKAVNPNFRYIDLMSMANGAIRPAGASYRDQLAQGIYRDCGHPALNEFFAPTLGYLVYQCQIIGFLNKFCGYTMGEADIVRRHFAKKTGTESDIPIIRDGGYMNENHYIKGFIQTMHDDYGVEKEEAENLLTDILQVIVDASDYLFSQNHADPYSFIGFAIGYLRYYYPLETITAALNIYMADTNKSAEIKKYANRVGIEIKPIKFGKSQAQYFFDKKENCIYQGIESIKFCNAQMSQELYNIRDNHYDNFLDLYKDVVDKTTANSKQIEILVELDYFSDYGKPMELLTMIDWYNKIANKKVFSKDKLAELGVPEYLMAKYSKKETAKQFREVDTEGLLQEILATIDYPKTRVVDRIIWQKEYLGVITLLNPKLDSAYCFVEKIDKNRVQLYQLKTGNTLNVKVRAKAFNLNKFEENSIIKVQEIVSEPKWINAGTKPDGKIDWQRSTTDYEDILKKWN